MEFKIECPRCNQHYSVDDSLIGQNVECSVCGKEFVVRRPPVSTQLSSSTSPESKASDATSFFRTATAVASRNNTVDWMTKQNYKPTVPWTRLTPAVDHKPEKKTFLPKSKMRRVFVAIAFLFLIVLCVVYVKVIPEKEYKNGLRAYNEQRTEDAIVHFQKAADYGHEKAKAEVNYIKGMKTFVEHRYSEAVEHFQKAANLGHSDAQVLLGLCYANGDGISRNVDESVQWFRRAAEQNNPEAQYRMGLAYLVGIGVNSREEEAIFLLQKAIEQGHHEAQISLGDLHYEKADRLPYHSESANLYYSKALECYQNASKTGDVSGKIRTKMFSCKMALNLDVK